jgi:hypothetical protein
MDYYQSEQNVEIKDIVNQTFTSASHLKNKQRD